MVVEPRSSLLGPLRGGALLNPRAAGDFLVFGTPTEESPSALRAITRKRKKRGGAAACDPLRAPPIKLRAGVGPSVACSQDQVRNTLHELRPAARLFAKRDPFPGTRPILVAPKGRPGSACASLTRSSCRPREKNWAACHLARGPWGG